METGTVDTLAPAPRTCTICQTPIAPGEASRVCEACGAVSHVDCWENNDGCGTYGCELAPQVDKMAPFETAAAGAWGDVKACPSCGEVLESHVLRCKKCKAKFDTRGPMTPEDYREQERRKSAGKRATALAVLLFCVSAFGILAPLTVVMSGIWIFGRSNPFRRAAATGELLVYSSFALSGLYVVLMAAIFGAGW